MTTAKRRAIGYVRVSTDKQVDHGTSLGEQERLVRDYCRTHDLRLVDVLRDEGESGANGLDTRVGLPQALALIKATKADVLVVSALSRLARDLMLQETIITMTPVISVTEPDIDSDDPTRVMIRQILGAVNQYHRALIRGNVLRGKAIKRERGGYAGGNRPYGTRPLNRELVPDHDEQTVIAEVVRLRSLTPQASYREICATLTDAGLRTRRGNAWQPAVVRRIAQRAGVA